VSRNLVEQIDYYFTEEGMMVFTENYHLERGFCCGNGCRHCPFNFEAVPEPRKSYMRALREQNDDTAGNNGLQE
jgi:hypothetical protein